MQAVKVTWVDAESTTEWISVDDLKDPTIVHTLGYLTKETTDTYFISASVYGDEKGKLTVGDTIAIPKAWVKEIFEIKDAPKRKTSRRT